MIGLASGILGGLESAYGLYENIKGNQMAKDNVRPTYTIPDEIKQNLTQSDQMALEGLPDAQKQQYIQNIQRSQQLGLNSLSDRKAGLSGIEGIVQSGNDAAGNLLSLDSTARRQNQILAMQQGQNLANYKDKAFDYNKNQPYQNTAAAARALQGAGLQNIAGGLGTIAGVMDRNGFGNGTASAPSGTYNPNAGASPQYNMGLGYIPDPSVVDPYANQTQVNVPNAGSNWRLNR